jgi:hypothetical protein
MILDNIISHCNFCEGCLTEESDVYGFGFVLVEIMSGEPVYNINRSIEEHLVDRRMPFFVNKDKISQIVDRRQGQYSLCEASSGFRMTLLEEWRVDQSLRGYTITV